MAHLTRQVMKSAGVMPERFALEWASAAEAPLYVELITKFTRQMKDLGPLGEAEGVPIEELQLKLMACRSAVEGLKLRTQFAKLTQKLRVEGEYTSDAIEAKMSEKINDAIVKELEKHASKIAESSVEVAE